MNTFEPELNRIPTPDVQPTQSTTLQSSTISNTKPFTLITGSSRGIGKAMANECAQKGMNLILVALPNEELEKVKVSLEKNYSVQVQIYEADLTLPGAPEKLYQWCLNNHYSVDTLINNAGIGQQGAFEDLELPRKLFLMNLNMNVLVSMVHCFLPMLKMHTSSHILNVSSMAGFAPVPYKSLYSASKSFVLTFSRALRFELKDTPVKVSCLCPGPTLTNPQNQMNARSIGKRGTLFEVQPDVVARHAIEGMLAAKEIIVPGWKHQFVGFFSRYLPQSMTISYSGNMFAASKKNASHS